MYFYPYMSFITNFALMNTTTLFLIIYLILVAHTILWAYLEYHSPSDTESQFIKTLWSKESYNTEFVYKILSNIRTAAIATLTLILITY